MVVFRLKMDVPNGDDSRARLLNDWLRAPASGTIPVENIGPGDGVLRRSGGRVGSRQA